MRQVLNSFLFETGLRIGEDLSLFTEDFNYENGSVPPYFHVSSLSF